MCFPHPALWALTRILIAWIAFSLSCGAVAQDTDAGPGAVKESENAAKAKSYGTVGYAQITGPIDRLQSRYVARVADSARELGLTTLLIRIDTDGGQVLYAREIFKRILDLEGQGINTIAFVDYRAISAGALIAYAHQELLLTETASIGDIGVVFRSPEGEIKYAPEKYETVIRTLLTQAAEQHGWSRGLLLKMTAHKQILYRVTQDQGRITYVIQDDLPDFLAANPEVDRKDEKQVIVYRGEDRLLTLTGLEAARMGMATATIKNLDEVYARLGTEAGSIVDLSPKTGERIAWALTTFAPVLAGLAMLFLIFELKTPGVGIWAALAAVLGAAFLLAQYSLDMLENFELVLMALGVALIVADVLTFAAGGLLALIGALIAFAGLVMSLIPNEFEFDLSDPLFLQALGSAALSSGVALGIVMLGMLLAIHYLPRTALHHHLAVEAEISGSSAGTLEARADRLIGQRGVALDMLRPSGRVQIGEDSLSARAEHGVFVPKGTPIAVVDVRLGEVVVEPLQIQANGAPPHDNA